MPEIFKLINSLNYWLLYLKLYLSDFILIIILGFGHKYLSASIFNRGKLELLCLVLGTI